LPLILG